MYGNIYSIGSMYCRLRKRWKSEICQFPAMSLTSIKKGASSCSSGTSSSELLEKIFETSHPCGYKYN